VEIYQIRGVLLFVSAFLNLVFALGLWFKGKTKATFHLGWVALFSALNAFTFGAVIFFNNKLFWARSTWLAMLMPAAYISFVYHFGERIKHIKLKPFFWYFWAIIISIIALTTPYVIKDISPDYRATVEQGFLRPVGRIYGVICIIVGFYYLLIEYFKSKGFKKEQIKYLILGFGIYSVGGIVLTGIIPLIDPNSISTDYSAFLSIIWIGLTTYAIFKKKLFEIKLILIEILLALIGVILLAQIFLAESFGAKIFELILFLLFSIIGYLLIKTTYQDIKRKERAEGLAKELGELSKTLEQKVKERTKELEKSYKELEKKKEEVEKRTEELERFHKLTVGRELEMVNLKKKIKELEEKLERLR